MGEEATSPTKEELVQSFVEALKPLLTSPAPEPVAKATEPAPPWAEVSTALTKMAEGLDALTARVGELGTNEETTRDALVKSLDRIGTLEGATAVRKSVDGDDAIPSPVKKASDGAGVSFANVVKDVLAGKRVTMGHPGN